jgi:DNA recombination protein RmuC
MSLSAVVVVVVATIGVVVIATVVRRSRTEVARAVQIALQQATASLSAQAADERDAAVRAALEHAAVVAGQQFSTQLAAGRVDLDAKKDLIDSRLDQVRDELHRDLERLGKVVSELSASSSQQYGRLEQSLQHHTELTRTLSQDTRTLREALANSKTRGQWGERMAEDVLRLAGFEERINYVKQTAVEGARALPDFTFFMPRHHVLYMDVKFPLAAYLRYLEADSDAERAASRDDFVRDVRQRVRELAARDYARVGDRLSVDFVLLFLPNESIAGFIHDQDPDLIEFALNQRVVLCSPLTLFAFLGVIRQAYDQFMMEQASTEILGLLSTFGREWGRYTDSLDKVRTRLDAVGKEFEVLATTRRRQLERPLNRIESLRAERGLTLVGEPAESASAAEQGVEDHRELGA